ncbi:DUF4030 domain-containing protein [Gottfriedia acidiceleris]|uniref:DUF4030 domain-containing protein n=1 Tax=Gottfriedia acidiceleris TaxID=371036 RepID=A0ABY4JJL4_9BACI|nr:DUF4030 domain-containing protein [Gottfriedia acidiceleris]UPM53662.1 DUF4030 domain-containing protein [Gottfriedia acidiceleris]
MSHKSSRKIRRSLYGIIAAAFLILLTITSTYVSPAMAKVVANIPYFRLFIDQKEYKQALDSVIFEVVQEKGLDIYQMDVSVHDKKLTLTLVGSKFHVDKLRSDVIKDINAKLIAENYGKFDITVKRVSPKVRENIGRDLTPLEKQFEQKSRELQAKVEEYLKNNKYITPFPPQVRINKLEKYIYVSITKTEKRDAELDQAMRDLSKPYGKDFEIDIRKSDMTARQQEIRWENNGIIDILASGLMENKEFKVRGFSYSFHPLPLLIEVRVTLKSTDPKAKKLAERIQQEINTFIKTDKLTIDVRNDPYVVTVIGKDEKKITKNNAPRL